MHLALFGSPLALSPNVFAPFNAALPLGRLPYTVVNQTTEVVIHGPKSTVALFAERPGNHCVNEEVGFVGICHRCACIGEQARSVIEDVNTPVDVSHE